MPLSPSWEHLHKILFIQSKYKTMNFGFAKWYLHKWLPVLWLAGGAGRLSTHKCND